MISINMSNGIEDRQSRTLGTDSKIYKSLVQKKKRPIALWGQAAKKLKRLPSAQTRGRAQLDFKPHTLGGIPTGNLLDLSQKSQLCDQHHHHHELNSHMYLPQSRHVVGKAGNSDTGKFLPTRSS